MNSLAVQKYCVILSQYCSQYTKPIGPVEAITASLGEWYEREQLLKESIFIQLVHGNRESAISSNQYNCTDTMAYIAIHQYTQIMNKLIVHMQL